MKIILGTSIALDLFLYICFFIGFALALGGAKAGYWMIGIAFRCGPALSIISVLLKLIVIILTFAKDTAAKKDLYALSISSLLTLLTIGGIIAGIYYIGKVMSAVG